MKGFRNHRTWAALGTAWLTVALLASGCATYRPLNAGSHVPWAKTIAAARTGPGVPERRDVAGGAAPAEEVPIADLSGRVHRVERGEALGPIAQRYGVRLRELAAANDIGPPYTVFVGQMLRIPGGDTMSREMAAQPAAGQPGDPATVHVVRRGENVLAIARRYDVSPRSLVQLNGIRPPYNILVGQKLQIPGGEIQMAARANPREPVGAAAPPANSQGDGFIWPVSGRVVGRFGQTEDGQRRDGIDIAARPGTPVRAAEDGLVVYAGDGIRGYGRMILLRHDGGYLTTYAQNSALLVDVGDAVSRGQVIARTGDRLHFELRKGRKPINPESVLVAPATEVASSE